MKILNYDFKEQKMISVQEVLPPPPLEESDPVLARIKMKVDPDTFHIYKQTVESYFNEAFLYQMETENGIVVEKSRWEKE